MKSEILNSFFNAIADAGKEFLYRKSGKKTELLEPRLQDMCAELLSSRGEASGLAIARDIAEAYGRLSKEAHLEFFRSLQVKFGANLDEVSQSAKVFIENPNYDSLSKLTLISEAPLQELLRRLNTTPAGIEFLVKMREDLLAIEKSDKTLSSVDRDFHHLFNSWFNRGFLELRRIDWKTPANILEKLISYEAVHEFKDWDDMRRRLAADRRCFAFFHPSWPDEPLIFIQIALVKGLSQSIHPLIDEKAPVKDPHKADTAIFYSITNCQIGLRRVSFGNLLIKQVAHEISLEFPKIKTFSTLSPIPKFSDWLKKNQAKGVDSVNLDEISASVERSENSKEVAQNKDYLLTQCAHYLLKEKRGKFPLDPVARFHLGNGSRLERINWQANTNPRGLNESYGLMVNYLYDMNEIVDNHERYMLEQQIACSDAVRNMLPK